MRAREVKENNEVEECALLKSHVLVCTEDLKQERKHCEELQKEIGGYKKKIDEQDKDMKAVTSHLRACLMALTGQSSHTPLLQAPVTHPSQPIDEIHLHQNGPRLPLFDTEKKSYPKEI